MTLLQARTTIVSLCVVVLFVASGFASITVTNGSFQTLPSGVHLPLPGEFTFQLGGIPPGNPGIPGWIIVHGSLFTGQFHPFFGTGGDFDSEAPNGGVISAYSLAGLIEQDVGTVQEGQIYTLTVELGHRNHSPFESSADLLVGSTTIPATGTPPDPGHWSPFTARFVGTAANEGETIMIQLTANENQGNFGSVSLTSEPVPEPSSMLLLGSAVLGLAQVVRRKLM